MADSKNKGNSLFKYGININTYNLLFEDFNILGEIKLNTKYDQIINTNLKIINIKIEKEYLKIIEKL